METFYHNLKLTQLQRKVKITYINGHSMFGSVQKQTATLSCKISTVWERKPRTTQQKTSRPLKETEQDTKTKTLQDV
jgi:hypothetical protein